MLTADEIKAMRERCEAATPGPWQTRFIFRMLESSRRDPKLEQGTKPEQDWPDAAFIAAARSDLPRCLDEIERLRGALAGTENARDQYFDWHGEARAEIADLKRRLAEGDSRYNALVSHLQGPTGWVIDGPGRYEIFIRAFKDGSGFVTSLERQDLDAPVVPEAAYPSQNWRSFHQLCDRAEMAEAEAAALREALDINGLVDRFLAWPLPDSVCSDQCACIPGYPHRSGTILLTAEEAGQMLRHVLAITQPTPGSALIEELKLLREVAEQAETCIHETGFFDGTFFSEARRRLKHALATLHAAFPPKAKEGAP